LREKTYCFTRGRITCQLMWNSKGKLSKDTMCQGFTKLHSGWDQTDSGHRNLKNILLAIPPRTHLGKQVPGNADHGRLSRTRTFRGNHGEDVSGCHPDFQSFILFSFLCILIGLTSLASIYSQTSVLFSSVLKSTLFTPNSSPQSSLLIPDLFSPSEIETFRCYEGTAHKLRPSPFRIHLWSLEFIILLPEPNTMIL
jgi:hypothetical protein